MHLHCRRLQLRPRRWRRRRRRGCQSDELLARVRPLWRRRRRRQLGLRLSKLTLHRAHFRPKLGHFFRLRAGGKATVAWLLEVVLRGLCKWHGKDILGQLVLVLTLLLLLLLLLLLEQH